MGQAICSSVLNGIELSSDGRVLFEELLQKIKEDDELMQFDKAVKAISKMTPKEGKVLIAEVETTLENVWGRNFQKNIERLKGKRTKTRLDDDDGGWGDTNADWGEDEKDAAGTEEKEEADGDDGWDDNEPEMKRTESWGSTGETNEGDWDEGEGNEDWGEEEPTLEQVDSMEDIIKPKKSGSFFCLSEGYLMQEVFKKSKALADAVDIPRGVATNLLRSFKWNKERAIESFFSDPRRLKKKAYTTHPPIESKETKVRCMFRAQLSGKDEKEATSSSKQKKTPKLTAVEKAVEKLIKKAKSQAEIYKTLGSKFKLRDVMMAVNKMNARMAAESLASESLTICESNNGIVPVENATQLRCGHWACNDCWESNLRYKAKSGRECINFRCQYVVCKKRNCRHKSDLGCFCQEAIPREMFVKFLKTEEVGKYDKWMATQYSLDNRSTITHCPQAGCEWWLKPNPSELTSRATCLCGKVFCFSCGRAPHNPVPCFQYEDFQERGKPMYLEKLWLESSTLPCPKCKAPIEKNKACLHMTCICTYEFCWACGQKWQGVGHGFYNCPKYKKNEDAKTRDEDQQRAIRELSKFKWYQRQMDVTRKEMEEAQKRKAEWEKEMEDKTNSYRDYAFVFDALDTFLLAKEQMLNLSIIAFYFQGKNIEWRCPSCTFANGYGEVCQMCNTKKPKEKKSDSVKEMFEFQQRMMVKVTTSLKKCFEDKTLDNVLKEKKNVQTKANACSKFIRELVRDVESGKYTAYILEQPDDSISGWFCIRCEQMNKFDTMICKSPGCEACQVHGEPACLRCNPRQ
mmetsp:Transcript_12677/g.20733  ORF Transcript_12677/g.20733 Transcript_12677/m.20733 type:complete len:801 (-) Transcript_12677:269-2671(-)